MKDNIFDSSEIQGEFKFDEKVAQVFDDMLSRSVPFYGEVQRIIAELSLKYWQEGTRIYDLGCSTATTIINICSMAGDRKLLITGIDSSEPVIAKAREKVEKAGLKDQVELLCSDINDVEFNNASVVIMNYTLQFITPENRPTLIKKIYDGLVDGGILLLSEKVLEEDEEMSNLFIDKYYEFKKKMGYSDLEIAKKREALDKVLIPFTVDSELDLLRQGGFKNPSLFFKWFNFASFIAVKGRSNG
ncbi:MAG: carboxy-S-adenosyl-L-methionine synthase CmoA [Deltaproteobacteria bacterium]|nr:carboxy-S-adenosyl-L-methionine synthase CmoA [Deltaproteobacteria bacterium]